MAPRKDFGVSAVGVRANSYNSLAEGGDAALGDMFRVDTRISRLSRFRAGEGMCIVLIKGLNSWMSEVSPYLNDAVSVK